MRKENGCNRKDCVYRSENCGWFVTCDYLLITHEVRGCPIGDECTKYTPGERKQKWMSAEWFRGQKCSRKKK